MGASQMSTCIVTGSCGLIGSEASRWFAREGFRVIGIDNNMRARFFGKWGSTLAVREELERLESYTHVDADFSSNTALKIINVLGSDTRVVIHAAAQPSHDWAGKHPELDFRVNALGTQKLLEAVRHHCPDAVFIFCSTNKVYGEKPNYMPYTEAERRWVPMKEAYWRGFPENLGVDNCMHSLFGASKLAADILVQEYHRYYGLTTVCFRLGCVTGPRHAGVELHGFLAYLMHCVVTGKPYTVYGYKGKQVRDNIHAKDVVAAFWEYFRAPKGYVFNLGGGCGNSCSVLEAIEMAERIAGRKLEYTITDKPRKGDHVWWVTDNQKFQTCYPNWRITYTIPTILEEIHEAQAEHLAATSS